MPEAATLPPPEISPPLPKEAKSAPEATAEKDSVQKTEVGEKAREKQNAQDMTKLTTVRHEMQGARKDFDQEKKATDAVLEEFLLLRGLKGVSHLIEASTKTDMRAAAFIGSLAFIALADRLLETHGVLDANTTAIVDTVLSGIGGTLLGETFKPATYTLNKIDQWRGERALKKALKQGADIEPQLLIPFVSEYGDLLPEKDAVDFIYDEQPDKGMPADPRFLLAKTLADTRLAHLTAGRTDLSDEEKNAYLVQAREYAVMKIGEGQKASQVAKRSSKSITKEVAARVLNLAGGSGFMAGISLVSGEVTSRLSGGREGSFVGIAAGAADDAFVWGMRKLGARRQKETIPVADAKPKNTG